MDMDFELMAQAVPLLLTGAAVTVQITALSVLLGILIGLFVGVARISTYRAVNLLAAVYVDFLRGTPLLVQIFLVYFALPVVTGQRIDPFFAAIAACSINSSAYVAEIF
ncbi:MAG: ABC transporter permease subunit, partial [Schwartzia sp.]|nr:ABC transporter permease subunit [Schwartzia sp. (in: firmicutes)]